METMVSWNAGGEVEMKKKNGDNGIVERRGGTFKYTGVKVPGSEVRFQGHLIDGADTGIWNGRNLRK